jgi:dolichol-phosphate mannosyltransferase
MNMPISQGPGPADCSYHLAVIIPMYNEIAGAEFCVRTILAILPSIGVPTGLIVVDDGSTDGTGRLLDDLQAALLARFRVVHKPNGGYGSALIAGAHAAAQEGYDYVLFMDSDLTNPPEHIERFVPAIRQGIDLVKASRFSSGGDMRAVPWSRWVWSVGANVLARTMFRMGIPDCTNGFRAIRTAMFQSMPLKERGFSIILEELYWTKRCGGKVAFVPTSLRARTAAQRSSAFHYRPALFWSYLKFALRASTFRYRPRSGPLQMTIGQ